MATKKKVIKQVPPPPVADVQSLPDNVESKPKKIDRREKTKILYLTRSKPDAFTRDMEKQVAEMEDRGYELISHSHCVADVGMSRAISAVGVYKFIYNLKT